MASKGGAGSTRNGRDSNPKYLGVKSYAGQTVKAGAILVKQNGYVYKPGLNVGTGKNFTLFAKKSGKILFPKDKVISVI